MTPEQLRILKTLPKVIEAVRAFQVEANELMGLLGATPAVTATLSGGRVSLSGPASALPVVLPPEMRPPPVLRTLQAVPDPDPRAIETRRAAEAELLRRKGDLSPEERTLVEQADADAFVRQQAGQRDSLLAAILPGGKP